MEYLAYENRHFDDLLEMALALWKDFSRQELKKALHEIEESDNKEVFFAQDKETLVGFVYVSIRYDYVEGADASPTGYLEGIYVRPDFRKAGVAHELFKLGEQWAAQKGCHQMGSDTWEWNKSSIDFHLKIGFTKEDTLVHFIKNIKGDD